MDAKPKNPKKRTSKEEAALAEAVRKQNERETNLSLLLGQGDERGLRLVQTSGTPAMFEESVLENMAEFGSSREEAERDTVKEFKLLGMDMSQFETRG